MISTVIAEDGSLVRMKDRNAGSRCATRKVNRETMRIWYRPARCLHKPDDMLTMEHSLHTKDERPKAREILQEHDKRESR
jgi:hypothetical protein